MRCAPVGRVDRHGRVAAGGVQRDRAPADQVTVVVVEFDLPDRHAAQVLGDRVVGRDDAQEPRRIPDAVGDGRITRPVRRLVPVAVAIGDPGPIHPARHPRR